MKICLVLQLECLQKAVALKNGSLLFLDCFTLTCLYLKDSTQYGLCFVIKLSKTVLHQSSLTSLTLKLKNFISSLETDHFFYLINWPYFFIFGLISFVKAKNVILNVFLFSHIVICFTFAF